MARDLWLTTGVAIALGTTAPAFAQEINDEWRVSVTPYLWVSAVDTEVTDRSSGEHAESSTSFGDLLDDFSGGFIGKGEVQYKRVGAYADIIYLKLSSDHTVSGPLLNPVQVEADVGTTIATLSAFYRVVETEQLNVDLLGGLRYINVDLELDFDGVGPGLSRDASRSVTEGIVGARATTRIGPRSSLTGYGDWGGFSGSTTVWQLYGTYNYQWTERLTVSGGYRYFSVDLENNRVESTVILSGPLLGLTYRF